MKYELMYKLVITHQTKFGKKDVKLSGSKEGYALFDDINSAYDATYDIIDNLFKISPEKSGYILEGIITDEDEMRNIIAKEMMNFARWSICKNYKRVFSHKIESANNVYEVLISLKFI